MFLSDVKIFSGSSNLFLAKKISNILNIDIIKSNIIKFSDGEIMVDIKESVSGKNVFLIQSISSPSNDNLIELLLIIDSLNRSFVKNIFLVIPYFGYARQDRKIIFSRVSVAAKVVSNLISNSNVKCLIVIDIHSEYIQGFFDIPLYNLYSYKIFLNDILKKKFGNLVIISPDFGGIHRSKIFSKYLNCDFSIIYKVRPKFNASKAMNIIGDVKNKICVIIDDIVDTAGTLIKSAELLKIRGAKKVFAYCTHPVLSNKFFLDVNNSFLDELIVTDSIYFNENKYKNFNFRKLTCSYLLSNLFKRILKII